MLHYIGIFTDLSKEDKRMVSAAAVTKMKYVALKLSQAYNETVMVFSPGRVESQSKIFYSSKKYELNKFAHIEEAASFSSKTKLLRIFNYIFLHFQLLRYLFFKVKDEDVLVVYHTLFYKNDIRIYRKIKKTKVIMEIEELYMAAWMKNNLDAEIRYLSGFDGYIYVNDIMNVKFQFKKPYAVCYGNYDVSGNCKTRTNEKTLIYAGGLGKKGSDVDLAINVMAYLPDYKLVIAGSGHDDEIKYVKDRIKEYSNIEYVGFLTGDEYEKCLDTIKFGLCTRMLPNNLSDYTFPSKIFVYLSHGIIPVCPMLNCISESEVNDYVLFYEKNNPELVANCILNCSIPKEFDKKIEELDDKFLLELKAVLSM